MPHNRAGSRTPARRRQRSVRVTLAVVLLSVATVAVLAALPTQSALLLSISSVLALVLGWAALRVVWTEVLQSRRENAADRAAAASAYRSLFTERAAEHAEFTTAMTERLAESNLSLRELQGALVQAEARVLEAETQARQERAQVAELQEHVASLEHAEAVRAAEEADALALWEAEGGDPIVELMAWDEKSAASTNAATSTEDPARKGA